MMMSWAPDCQSTLVGPHQRSQCLLSEALSCCRLRVYLAAGWLAVERISNGVTGRPYSMIDRSLLLMPSALYTAAETEGNTRSSSSSAS